MEQKPSIGRIVHYRAHGSPDGTHKPEARAAIITGTYKTPEGEIDALKVDLAVFNPTGMFFNVCCKLDSDGQSGGSWRWPPRA